MMLLLSSGMFERREWWCDGEYDATMWVWVVVRAAIRCDDEKWYEMMRRCEPETLKRLHLLSSVKPL